MPSGANLREAVPPLLRGAESGAGPEGGAR